MFLKGRAQGFWGVLAVIGIYTATVIGAGFASGAEIEIFFARHGVVSLIGIALVTLLFSLSSVSVLLRVHVSKVTSFKEYLSFIASEKLAAAIDLICMLFLFSCFCVMVAGIGAVARQQFGFNPFFACLAFLAVCYIIFCFGIKGIAAASALLAPIMILGMLVASVCSFFGAASAFFDEFTCIYDNFFVSAAVYVSYNILTAAAVLATLGSYIKGKRAALLAGVGGSVLLGVTALFIVLALLRLKTISEIPMLIAAALLSPVFEFYYSLVLIFAMLTTAVSCGFALTSRLCDFFKVKRWLFCLFICVLALFISEFGFVQLVGKLYGFFGYLGILLLALILIDLYRLIKKGHGLQGKR